jgi:methylthioribose-1-phosphate isomerase
MSCINEYTFNDILSLLYRFVMEKVDLVMVGAEGVAESGGIINKVGRSQVNVTFNLVSMVAHYIICYSCRLGLTS